MTDQFLQIMASDSDFSGAHVDDFGLPPALHFLVIRAFFRTHTAPYLPQVIDFLLAAPQFPEQSVRVLPQAWRWSLHRQGGSIQLHARAHEFQCSSHPGHSGNGF